MRFFKLFNRYVELKFKRLIEYRVSFFLGLTAGLITILAYFAFWSVIFSRISSLNNWTFSQLIALLGFFYVAMGFFWTLLDGSSSFYSRVVYGELDELLVRPAHPVLLHMLSSIDLMGLIDLSRGVLTLFIAVLLGLEISLFNLAVALLISLLGAVILSFIFLAVGFLSFWLGKTEAFQELWNVLWEASEYPISVFPVTIQVMYTFLLPLIFIQTYPALLVSKPVSIQLAAGIILMELLVCFAWFLTAWILWEKGIKRYESLGG